MRTGERIERRLVPTDRLDALAERLQGVVRRALGRPAGGRMLDVLHGTWLGHPLHPSLTDVPIGFWMASAVADAAGERRMADRLGAVGVAGALAAGASGAADWSRAGRTGSRVGLVHAVVNLTATALSGAALGARRAGTARALRLAGLGLAGAGAWLGGKLVYGESLGVDHTAWEQGPEDWFDVAAVGDLPEGELRRVEAGGLAVALLRRGDEVLAIGDTCSHLGGPLSEGDLDGEVVTCPWHGSRFCMRDGSVVAGPATFPQPRLEVRVRAGRVEVREALRGAPLT